MTKLPSKVRLGQIWMPIRRDSSECFAFLKSDVEAGTTDPWYLAPGVYSCGFLKVTDVTHKVPDNRLSDAFRGLPLSPAQVREQYVIIRRYSVTTG